MCASLPAPSSRGAGFATPREAQSRCSGSTWLTMGCPPASTLSRMSLCGPWGHEGPKCSHRASAAPLPALRAAAAAATTTESGGTGAGFARHYGTISRSSVSSPTTRETRPGKSPGRVACRKRGPDSTRSPGAAWRTAPSRSSKPPNRSAVTAFLGGGPPRPRPRRTREGGSSTLSSAGSSGGFTRRSSAHGPRWTLPHKVAPGRGCQAGRTRSSSRPRAGSSSRGRWPRRRC
mmetsp:Transcript_50046/g.113613  ORF Transcript_50046/g.113613 Transcript_50046/m.113613 type:complete len:233 (+) Transcript_50046:652-1350(+)